MSTDTTTTHGGLLTVLNTYAGMAGDDSVGQQWASSYDQAARTAIAASSNLTTACGQTRNLLVIGAYNHEVAETVANHRNVPLPQPPPLVQDPCLAEIVSSAAGDGIPEPFGWSILKDAVGFAWPNGNQDQLNAAADAWHTASSDYRTIAGNASSAVSLLNNQQSPEIDISVQTCTDRQTDLNALADACQTLGDACSAYAGYLDDAHQKILAEVREMVIEAAAWEAGAAILLPFTGSLSEWVGNSALAGRVVMKARRIATIISGLAAKVAEIVTKTVTPLLTRLEPLLEKVRVWVAAARTKYLGATGRELFSRGGALTNREVLEQGVGLPQNMETVEYYARLAGVDFHGGNVDILTAAKDGDTIRYLDMQGAIARTDDMGIQLGPAAFQDPETLVRTLAHEAVHVKQYQQGAISSATAASEAEAYAAEDAYVETWRRNTQ
ncbi:WXG100-like domain-containing protein [Nocardia vaccinii]|uniref:WXG100-like domain-containing protein n=1 Tax=Nocardia vaccinii TaxID=1822 RepID=UPI000AD98C78|nr:hypothetical protein [Nocardia vaccinii]